MKRLFTMGMAVLLVVALTACQLPFLTPTSATGQKENPDAQTAESAEPASVEQEQKPDMELFEIDTPENRISVFYKDDGVHVQFEGDNRYGNGYAFLPDSDLLWNEATYWSDGYEVGEEQGIVFSNAEEITVFDADDTAWDSGIVYMRTNDTEEALSDELKGQVGVPQQWQAVSLSVYTDYDDTLVEYDDTATTMTTIYQNGTLTATFQGTEHYSLENSTVVLNGEGWWFSDDRVELMYPDDTGDFLLVSIHPEHESVLVTFGSHGYFGLTAVFRRIGESPIQQQGDQTPLTGTPDHIPVTGLTILSPDEWEYPSNIPWLQWEVPGDEQEQFTMYQYKTADGVWQRPHRNGSDSDDGFSQIWLNEDDYDRIVEIRAVTFLEQYEDYFREQEVAEAFMDSYPFTEGVDWIKCDLHYIDVEDKTRLTLYETRPDDWLVREGEIAVGFAIDGLVPSSPYDFSFDNGEYSRGTGHILGDTGVFTMDDVLEEDVGEWDFDLGDRTSGTLPNSNHQWSLTGYTTETLGENTFEITRTHYYNFYLERE